MKTRTAHPSCKLTKAQLADALAKALNLLNDLSFHFGDEYSTQQTNAHWEVASVLKASEEVRADWSNNGTLHARDLI